MFEFTTLGSELRIYLIERTITTETTVIRTHRQYLLARHDEVQKGPELLQRVLQGCSRDKQPVVGLELHHGLVEE